MRASWSSAVAVVVSAVCGLSVAACDDKPESSSGPVTPVRQGDVGAVAFSYACAGPGDVQCNVDAELAPVAKDSAFPLIAAGTTFVVGMKWNPEGAPPSGPLATIGAGSTIFGAETSGDRTIVSARKPGRGALLGLSGTQIVDLTTIDVHAVDRVKVLRASPQGDFKDGSITLGDGKLTTKANVQYTFKFRAVPVDAAGAVLAGTLPIMWTSADPNVVKLTSAANDNVAVFESGAAGNTTIHVTVGDKSADITISVGG